MTTKKKQVKAEDLTIYPSSDCPLCKSPDTYLLDQGKWLCEDCGHEWRNPADELDEVWTAWSTPDVCNEEMVREKTKDS